MPGIGRSSRPRRFRRRPAVTVRAGSASSRWSSAARASHCSPSGQSAPPPSACQRAATLPCAASTRQIAQLVLAWSASPANRTVTSRSSAGVAVAPWTGPACRSRAARRPCRRRSGPPTPRPGCRRRRRSSVTGSCGVAQPLRQPQRPELRLGQVADGQQPEAAVQQPRRPAQLLEVVGGHPRRQRRRPARPPSACRAAGTSAANTVSLIRVAVGRGDAPLGPQQRPAAGEAGAGPAAGCRRRGWTGSRPARRPPAGRRSSRPRPRPGRRPGCPGRRP